MKKNEEKIKREIQIASENNRSTNETGCVNMIDQMLLKFYLKHIEDNLSEINAIYEILNEKLSNSVSSNSDEMDEETGISYFDNLANKLAINGHKLIFISDTLQRNLNNIHLKTDLIETSSSLCDSLKLYMIRLKASNLALSQNEQKQKQLIADSLANVLNTSVKFKQIIIKYYFKSY